MLYCDCGLVWCIYLLGWVRVAQSLLEHIHDFIHAVHDELPAFVDLCVHVLLVAIQQGCHSGVVVVPARAARTDVI